MKFIRLYMLIKILCSFISDKLRHWKKKIYWSIIIRNFIHQFKSTTKAHQMYTMMHSIQWKTCQLHKHSQNSEELHWMPPRWMAFTGVQYECYLCPWEFLLLVYIYSTLPCRLIGNKSIASHTRHQAGATANRDMQNGNSISCISCRYMYSSAHTLLT